jgi:DNA-binding CsgD family transcriptional regulator
MPVQKPAANTTERHTMAAEKIKKEQITKPTKRSKLKPIDKQIVKLISEGKSQTEVAGIVGQSRETINRKLSQNVTIIETLERCGITDEYLANKHKELLESKRKLYNPKTQTFEDVPDNNARNTALSIGYRVRGHLKDNPEQQTNIQINIVKYEDQEKAKVEGNTEQGPIIDVDMGTN